MNGSDAGSAGPNANLNVVIDERQLECFVGYQGEGDKSLLQELIDLFLDNNSSAPDRFRELAAADRFSKI